MTSTFIRMERALSAMNITSLLIEWAAAIISPTIMSMIPAVTEQASATATTLNRKHMYSTGQEMRTAMLFLDMNAETAILPLKVRMVSIWSMQVLMIRLAEETEPESRNM